jgi:hypothetical protein
MGRHDGEDRKGQRRRYETANTGQSPASSARDRLAIPDDDNAPDLGSLSDGFWKAGRLVCGCAAADDDDALADLGLVHGNPCLGDGFVKVFVRSLDGHHSHNTIALPDAMDASRSRERRTADWVAGWRRCRKAPSPNASRE